MPLASGLEIISRAREWGAGEVTFLGGEPTLYPHLRELVLATKSAGLRPRIVTNAQGAFKRFAQDDTMRGVHVCVSIDGASSETHDAIRGQGSLRKLLANVKLARGHGFELSAITSISRQNAQEAFAILELCAQLGLASVNVHYVSSRGSASEDAALSPSEWDLVCQEIERASQKYPSLDIRYERTFVSTSSSSALCAVRDRTNLMFLPDGRVFYCMMFIDIPNAHSYEWDGRELRTNRHCGTEHDIVRSSEKPGCPALALVNPEIVAELPVNHCVECIYAKYELSGSSRDQC